MTIFRAFRNSDPPAIVDLWNRGLPDRGVVRPLTAHEFDTLVMGKLGFDRLGLIVAEEEGRVLGFAHAGFGPCEPKGPSHALDTSMGTIAMLVTDPDSSRADIESGLLREAERYLRSRGAQVIYAGGQAPLNPFYAGIYGGSEFSGVLADHASFTRAVSPTRVRTCRPDNDSGSRPVGARAARPQVHPASSPVAAAGE